MKKITITTILLLLFSIAISANKIFEENLEVRLLIIGQGDPVYSSWGHIGLAIKNEKNNMDIFFDFGNFVPAKDEFVKNFAYGRMLYEANAIQTERYISYQKYLNRNITEYTLNLSAENKLKMYNDLSNIVLPENRYYLYHNYNDNCSTRIRDYIDIAIGGQLKDATDVKNGSTYRKSFLKFFSYKKVPGYMLSILQGPNIDREITTWQEMYLPESLENAIKDLKYEDSNGNMVPLVASREIVYKADGRKELPESFSPPYLIVIIISILLSCLILFLNFKSRKGNRIPFSIVNILFGLVFGLLGSVLLFLAVLTDHNYSFYNLNLFMINPLALFSIPAAILFWIKGDKWRGKLDIIWSVQLLSTIIMVLIKVCTPVKQSNLLEIILILPILLAFTPIIPKILQKKLN